ncbi:MAG: AAA family ATPase [Bacillota bacterium]|nr:AAA family ATPase [Bacillota bacterium]
MQTNLFFRSSPAVCQPTPLRILQGHSKNKLAYCDFPPGSAEELTQTFCAAPQYANVETGKLLEEDSLRVLLFGTDSYYLRQAAVYLSAIHSKHAEAGSEEEDDFWCGCRFGGELADAEDASCISPIRNSLTVISPALLDPEISMDIQSSAIPSAMMELKKMDLPHLSQLDTTDILIASESGAILTNTILEEIEALFEKDSSVNIFIAVKPEQADPELLEELRFTYGFQDCPIGHADMAYLQKFLKETADQLLIPLDASIDTEQVILSLRSYRKDHFTEMDLGTLLLHSAKAYPDKPLTTADLSFLPKQNAAKGDALEELNRMIGLKPIKEALQRLLASAILEDRHRLKGMDVTPSCRNMAFSGSPGTGKSVTARLIARIMREKGCGSGRFVEAGREQLIGSYLGQTSPMIAKLFQQARGGVLFIDEAGALLNGSHQDIYATEAVNALVRHMELEPETIVIFATYPTEMQELLHSNPGLSSRIAQVLDFPDYDEAELLQIFHSFVQKECFDTAKGCNDVCLSYFRRLKAEKKEHFGNGREARRLFQAAKEEFSLYMLTHPDAEMILTPPMVQAAVDRLLSQEKQEPIRIGF